MSWKPEEIAARYRRGIATHALAVLVMTAITCAASVLLMFDVSTQEPRLTLDSSIESILSETHAGRQYLDRTRETFDTGQTVLVAVVTEETFTAENLLRIQRISERVSDLDYVQRVSSLATSLNIRSEGDELLVEPFYDDVPTSPGALVELRERALSDPIYAGNLISPDGRISLIVAYLLPVSDQELLDADVDGQIAAIAEQERGDAEIWLSGDLHVKAEMSRLTLADVGVVVPLTWLVMACVAFFSFRSLRGVLIPILTVQISLLLTLGFIAFVYGSLNIITVAAPPVLVVVGLAYAIHMVAAYYDALREAHDLQITAKAATTVALGRVTMPVIFTGLTTAGGFLSLLMSPLAAIQQFGVFCGVGVVFTCVVSLTFAPALLALLPIPLRIRQQRSYDALDRLLEWLAIQGQRNAKGILIASVLVALVAFIGVFRIEIRTETVGNFKADNVVRQDFERINTALKGANSFSVVFESDRPSEFTSPESLAVIEGVQSWLAEQPEVGSTTSFVDYMKVLNRGFHEGRDDAWVIPESRELVSQLLIIGDNEELGQYVDSSYRNARVLVKTSATSSSAVMQLVERLEEHLEAAPAHLNARVTGSSVLISRAQDDVAYGQATSLASAFVFIYVILAMLFTSWRVGALALLPNALPVLIYFGVLGWSGVTLNISTAIVACLVLGIAVDDTIHLLTHFNSQARRVADEGRGATSALRTVGRPITFTTAALCLGFLTMMLSQTTAQIEFGWLAAFTMGCAWLVDVTLTPVLASKMRIVTLWDVLTLDLGDEPHRSIPLFAGLTPGQAKTATLMASIKRFRQGHELCRVGDKGDELYVVLDGQLMASIEKDAREVPLRVLRRGDVIGEVAILQGERTADVRTLEEVRLLRFTQCDFERLKRRHPRISAQLHINLSRVLAERLTSLTWRMS